MSQAQLCAQCGYEVPDTSPSEWFCSEPCQRWWTAKKMGLQPSQEDMYFEELYGRDCRRGWQG